jgi:hypothetical protein
VSGQDGVDPPWWREKFTPEAIEARTKYVMALMEKEKEEEKAATEAKKLQRYVDGTFYENKAYQLGQEIFRDGTIALITEEPVSFTWKLGTRSISTSQRIIFVNSVLNEGFSGAPVFLWPGIRSTPKGSKIGGKPWLIGIVHGFFPQFRNVIDAEGNDVVIRKQESGPLGQINPPRELFVYSQENPATGIVFPAWRLLDILQRDDVKKRIQELTDKETSKEEKN